MKVLKISSMIVAVALVATACGDGGKKETVEAGDAQEVQASTGTELMVDAAASEVAWVGFKDLAGAFKSSHNGTVDVAKGSLTVNDGKLEGGSFAIDLTTINCLDLDASQGKGNLEGHLQSMDFFGIYEMDGEGNVTATHEENKTATFEITGIAPYSASMDSEGEADEWSTANPTHNVTGNLTMRGVTKSITIPAHVEISDAEVKAMAKFYVNRIDWGITYGAGNDDIIAAAKDEYIRDEMGIGLNIVAKAAMTASM